MKVTKTSTLRLKYQRISNLARESKGKQMCYVKADKSCETVICHAFCTPIYKNLNLLCVLQIAGNLKYQILQLKFQHPIWILSRTRMCTKLKSNNTFNSIATLLIHLTLKLCCQIVTEKFKYIIIFLIEKFYITKLLRFKFEI